VVRRFVAQHPAGTVVALGEGLETQFWRVDNVHTPQSYQAPPMPWGVDGAELDALAALPGVATLTVRSYLLPAFDPVPHQE
jgi:hypothetical protein